MQLRDYQATIVDKLTTRILDVIFTPMDAVEARLDHRYSARNGLLIAGCGTGKTIMSTTIAANVIRAGGRVLFVCDLRVLPNQIVTAANTAGIEDISFLAAGHKLDRNASFIVAMAQTMMSRTKKSNFYDLLGPRDLIIYDECHQSRYSSAGKAVREYYRHAYDLGLTATPTRSSPKEYLAQWYNPSNIVEAPQTAEMITAGAVLPEIVYCPTPIIVDAGLSVSGGDYTPDSMAKQSNTKASIDAVVDGYFEKALGIPFAAYCVNLAHARLLADAFNERLAKTPKYSHMTVEYQDGNTKGDTRQVTYFRVRHGQVLGITSVGTMAVGFDLPSIGAILWCRKTQSSALYRQSVGRGCRVMTHDHDCYPNGKKYYMILDFSGDAHVFGLPSDHIIHDITDKPVSQRTELVKQCPKCDTVVNRMEIFCPNCGFEFSPQEADPLEPIKDEAYVELTEVFSGRSRKLVKDLRAFMAKCYSDQLSPSHGDKLFKAKHGHIPPPSWYLGLMYGKSPTMEDQINYWSYLSLCEDITSPTVRSVYFAKEFGHRFMLDPLGILDVQEGENIQVAYRRMLSKVKDADSLASIKAAFNALRRSGL